MNPTEKEILPFIIKSLLNDAIVEDFSSIKRRKICRKSTWHFLLGN